MTHIPYGGSGANTLSLLGYPDGEIQTIDWWKSDIFKEYISNQLTDFSKGMSKSMKTLFNFVNIEGGMYHDITKAMVNAPYSAPVSAT